MRVFKEFVIINGLGHNSYIVSYGESNDFFTLT